MEVNGLGRGEGHVLRRVGYTNRIEDSDFCGCTRLDIVLEEVAEDVIGGRWSSPSKMFIHVGVCKGIELGL